MPVARELTCDLFHRPARADLQRRPFRRTRGEQAVLGGDAVVGKYEALLRAGGFETAHPVLAPSKAHWPAIDRKVDVGDERALFHLRRTATGRTSHVAHYLLDHELDVSCTASIVKDANVLQTHQGLEDLTRVGDDEGASALLAHTSSLRHLRHLLVDLRTRKPPLKSDEPRYLLSRAHSDGPF